MAAPQREKAWTDFRAWCAARGLRALPAHPWTVAAYVRYCQGRHRAKTITNKVETIVRAHVLGGHVSPGKSLILKRTLLSVTGDHASRAKSPPVSGRPSLFEAKDFTGTERDGAGLTPAPGARKRALSTSPRLVSRKHP